MGFSYVLDHASNILPFLKLYLWSLPFISMKNISPSGLPLYPVPDQQDLLASYLGSSLPLKPDVPLLFLFFAHQIQNEQKDVRTLLLSTLGYIGDMLSSSCHFPNDSRYLPLSFPILLHRYSKIIRISSIRS